MQPLDYLNTTMGLIWVIACIPLGFVMTALGYLLINRIPAKWLCDYGETPSEELTSGVRIKFIWTGIPVSLLMSASLVLCRLQFNKGYDIYFGFLALIIFVCFIIAIADIKYQIIPDQFTIALGVLALGVSLYDILRDYCIFHLAWWSPLAGAGIGAVAMILIDFLGAIIYHKEGMGFGDVKLFLALGILTGFPGTIYTFIISLITATVCFVIVIAAAKIFFRKKEETDETKPEKTEEKKETGDEEETDEEENEADGSIGFGSYLAFGPYIAIAACAYIALFDQIQYLAKLYLNLF